MSRQWTLPLEISEFKADEYGKLAHVFGSIFPDYDRTPEEWRFEDESLDKSKFHFKRYSCINKETEEPVGFGQCQHVPWMYHPKKLWFRYLGRSTTSEEGHRKRALRAAEPRLQGSWYCHVLDWCKGGHAPSDQVRLEPRIP